MVFLISGNYYLKKYYPNSNFEKYKPHHAIVLLISEYREYSLPVGISVLIKAFLNKKCNFSIYKCHNIKDVDTVLKNQFATDLWIIGHGWRGGFGFKKSSTIIEIIKRKRNKPEKISYKDLINNVDDYPKKRFIAQLHCNPRKKNENNVTLPEILLSDPSDDMNSFVSSFYLEPVSIYLIIKFRLVKRIKCPQ